MKLRDLANLVPPNGLFRTGQILSGKRSPADVRRQLDRWVRSGQVLQLRRGAYALGSPYVSGQPHPFAVAQIIRTASYVSLQSALSHYGMIPEYVPAVTSVTTDRPEELDTPLGRFLFRHVATARFFGFREIEVSRDQRVLLATPAKALVDLLYLTAHSDNPEYLRELRLTRPDTLAPQDLRIAAGEMRSGKVERAVERLVALWQQEEESE